MTTRENWKEGVAFLWIAGLHLVVSQNCGPGQEIINGACVDCQPGHYLISGSCEECPRGFYQPQTARTSCLGCVEHTSLSTGSTSVDDCNIASCVVGEYRDASSNTCESCPLGTYQATKWKEQACEQCPGYTTTISTGSESPDHCKLICEAGKEDRGSVCENCEMGFYKLAEDATMCVSCPQDWSTTGTGSTSLSSCTVPICQSGNYLSHSDNQCFPCPVGTYQEKTGESTCHQCPLGSNDRLEITLQEAATSLQDCVLSCVSGEEYATETRECRQCDEGFYRSEGQQASCQRCPAGVTTLATGATSVEACTTVYCPEGQHRVVIINACTPCDKGTYQPTSGQTSCIHCPSGDDTASTGSVSLSQCTGGLVVSPCSQISCRNGGVCSVTSGTPRCACPSDFTGDLCDVVRFRALTTTYSVTPYTAPPKPRTSPAKKNLPYIVVGVVAGVILLVGVTLACVYCCNRRKPKDLLSSSSQDSSLPPHVYNSGRPIRIERKVGQYTGGGYPHSLPRTPIESLDVGPYIPRDENSSRISRGRNRLPREGENRLSLPPIEYPSSGSLHAKSNYNEYNWEQVKPNKVDLIKSTTDKSSNFLFYEETNKGPKVGIGLDGYSLDVS